MRKKRITAYVVGIISLVLTVLMIIFACLIATGSFHYRKTKIVVSTGSASKTYDGKPITNSTWKLVSGDLNEEHSVDVVTTGEQIEVGRSDNKAIVRVIDSSGLDVTDQYDIELMAGDLRVEPRKLRFTSESAMKMYDGRELKQPSAWLVSGHLAFGDVWEFDGFAAPVEVGIHENTFTVTVRNANGDDVTGNYDISCEFGSLEIKAGKLTLKSESAAKVYDGEPLSAEEVKISGGSLMPGHRLEAKAWGSITTVGLCSNRIEAKIYDGAGMDVTDQYDLKFMYGELTVTPRDILVRTKDISRHASDMIERNDWELISGECVEGDRLTVTTIQQMNYSPKFGEYENSVVTYNVVSQKLGMDVTACYRLSFVCGTFLAME